jgi:hypothetical protein
VEVAATGDNKNYDGGICIDPNIGDQSNPPSAARGRNQILYTGDGRALSAVSFQCSASKYKRQSA